MMRVAVLIDAGYFSAITKIYFHLARVDFQLLSDILCENCERVVTYYYTCMPYQSPIPTKSERIRYSRATRFIEALKKYDKFEVRLGRLVKRDGKFEQKGVDVMFALDLLRLTERKLIDKAIIISGDSDFVPAVMYANEQGIITQNIYYSRPNEFSYHLRDTCTEKREITQELIDKATF